MQDSLADAISTAYNQIGELGFEMEEQYDNAPEFAKDTYANECRRIAAFILGGLDEPLVPPSLRGAGHLVWWQEKRGNTRPIRRDNIVRCLRACIRHLSDVSSDESVALKEALQKAIDELKEVKFPSMFQRAA